jgi:putative membrane protein
MKQYVKLFITGFTMGTADLVPGVSGGTIAFLAGIYEQLLQSIKTVTGEVLRLVLQRRIRDAVARVPWGFLLPLGLGIGTAVLALAGVLSYLLDEHPVLIWSFFLGLVLASVVVVSKRVMWWQTRTIAAFVFAMILGFFIVGMVPVETPNNPFYMFLSGAVAICAMILPGISGSFILLLIGKYQQVLDAVNDRDVVTLGIFMVGAAVGIAAFSRLLSWLFWRYHDTAIAILAGLMLGSARKLWPWKETVETRIDSHGNEVPLVERNIRPSGFDDQVLFAALLLLLGIGLVLLLDRLRVVKSADPDLDVRTAPQTHISTPLEQRG